MEENSIKVNCPLCESKTMDTQPMSLYAEFFIGSELTFAYLHDLRDNVLGASGAIDRHLKKLQKLLEDKNISKKTIYEVKSIQGSLFVINKQIREMMTYWKRSEIEDVKLISLKDLKEEITDILGLTGYSVKINYNEIANSEEKIDRNVYRKAFMAAIFYSLQTLSLDPKTRIKINITKKPGKVITIIVFYLPMPEQTENHLLRILRYLVSKSGGEITLKQRDPYMVISWSSPFIK